MGTQTRPGAGRLGTAGASTGGGDARQPRRWRKGPCRVRAGAAGLSWGIRGERVRSPGASPMEASLERGMGQQRRGSIRWAAGKAWARALLPSCFRQAEPVGGWWPRAWAWSLES